MSAKRSTSKATSSPSPGARDGSLDAEEMTILCVKQLLTILKVRLLIYSIEACLKSGDNERASSLCKSTTQCLYSTLRSKRMRSFQRFLRSSDIRLPSQRVVNLLSRMA